MSEYNPKKYFFRKRLLRWGRNLTAKQNSALKNGEVFVLLSQDKKPLFYIVMDSYNQIREKKILPHQKLGEGLEFLGI